MVNFAFCYGQDAQLDFIKGEVLNYFKQRGSSVAVMCYHNAYELERCIGCNCPDVLFYDMEAEDGRMRQAAIAAKKQNKNMVSIVTHSRSSVSEAEDILLSPVYTMPDRNRRYLLSYALLAYETALDNEDSFSYYVRPDYVHTPIEDILYFASEGRRTHIVCSEYHDVFYQKLDDVERLIRPKNGQFMRIHKSYLVNARYIDYYSRDYVALTTGEKLRISRYEYYRMLNDRFQGAKRRASVGI